MDRTTPRSEPPSARIVCSSFRNLDPSISRCLRFEFEDLAAEYDSVEFFAPPHAPFRSARWRGMAARLDSAGLWRRPIAGARRRLAVATVLGVPDLYTMAPWAGLRSMADASVCCLEDLYARQIPRCAGAMAMLRTFDAIFVGCEGTVDALSKATGRPCYWLPRSIDALAFCPYPGPPERVIDFYSMGRRTPKTHAALVRLAERGNFFYHYDTTGNARVSDHREHRRRLADLIKRSRYFLVNVAQCTIPGNTGGQEELGYRYFEGAAAGAVLIGQMPQTGSARQMFDWPDAVIPLALDSDRIGEVIAELDADPARVERIRRANVVNSLRRFDHVYRWEQILSAVGLESTPAMEARKRALSNLADLVERQDPALLAGDRRLLHALTNGALNGSAHAPAGAPLNGAINGYDPAASAPRAASVSALKNSA